VALQSPMILVTFGLGNRDQERFYVMQLVLTVDDVNCELVPFLAVKIAAMRAKSLQQVRSPATIVELPVLLIQRLQTLLLVVP
jgi:hypothetical protein